MKKSVADTLSAAAMQGISSAELKYLKSMLTSGDAKPTKKYRTRAQRVARRKMQKESRRINRGVNQGKRATR